MPDPITALAIGGSVAGGVGGMASALNQPGGPQMINPEVQAWLQQQGIDISRYQAELAGGQQDYAQQIGRIPIQREIEAQRAYQQNYAPLEQADIGNALATLRGGISPATQNLLNAYGSSMGGQRSLTDERVNQMIAQSGIDPSSPAAQALRSQAQNEITGNFQNLMAQAQGNAMQNALGTIQRGETSNRLAGMNPLQTPMTTRETIAEAQKYKGTYQPYLGPAHMGGMPYFDVNPMTKQQFEAGQRMYGSTGNPYAPSSSEGSTQYMPQYMSPTEPTGVSALRRQPRTGGGSMGQRLYDQFRRPPSQGPDQFGPAGNPYWRT